MPLSFMTRLVLQSIIVCVDFIEFLVSPQGAFALVSTLLYSLTLRFALY